MLKMVLLNTSPAQYLFQLGIINCLQSLYGKIYLPEDDVQEIEIGSNDFLVLRLDTFAFD